MKKYAISIGVVLAVLAVTWSAFARAQDRAGQRQRFQNMSEEERAKMRERFQNMSDEERAKFRAQMAARGGSGRSRSRMSPEDQQKAIKAIEAQLVKLKAAAQIRPPEGGFRDMSEDERNKLMTAYRERGAALQAITTQIARLQGRQAAGEGARFIVISTSDLKPIQAAAEKEKAKETSQLLARLAGRGGRGFGGGRPGSSGQRPGGGGARPPGGRRGSDRQ
jgi:hypothetical protein